MIALVALLCLNGVCEEHRSPAPAGMVACLVGGQAELARLYPGWTVARWRCEAPGRPDPT